ncbi:DUF5304 domain-containing protein [Streptomyces sp. NPDC088261]|uniref:DUF5304 domain-containing protein n=1 Tax=Streptomyces sp. NPDC088261 TaxID=3365851 RepID=UPI003807C1AA
MSDSTERPAADSDAWATACAEDLEAEKARRRAVHGRPPASASEELRKLVDAVSDKVTSLQNPLFGMAAQGAVQQLINQARAAVEPVIERNPGVFDHLAAAGSELLAAYRDAVEGQESRWTKGPGSGPGVPAAERTDGPKGYENVEQAFPDAPGVTDDTKSSHDPTDPRDEGPGPDGRIDLD